MRVDIRHLMAKGELAKVVARCMAYAATMRQQGKPLERIIVSENAYAQLLRKAQSNGRHAVLCCGEALVHYDHRPIDESEPVIAMKPRFDAGLPPVNANPFGVAPTVAKAPKQLPPFEPMNYEDDDIPF